MDRSLIIANSISFVAAVFTCLSSLSHKRTKIYYYQVVQCVLLAVANIFFCSYAGIITLLLCALRNYLLGRNLFNKYACITIASLMLIMGLLINNNGYIGWIVIAANVIYTLGGYIARRELAIKINMIIDFSLWIIYEILIIDIPSLLFDSVSIVLAVISVISIIRSGKTKELPE